MTRRRQLPHAAGELPDQIRAKIELARRDGSAELATFSATQLRAAGLGGPPAGQADAAASAAASEEISPALTDVRRVFTDHSRTIASWTLSPLDANPVTETRSWRILVIDLDPPDVALVQVLDRALTDRGQLGDGDVITYLRRVDQLADQLSGLAYRPPVSAAEREATSGLQAVFIGPDRKAVAVPTRLLHEWDASRAKMIRWAYSMTGRRDPGDWIARRPMTLRRITRERYRDHLTWRMGRPTPQR